MPLLFAVLSGIRDHYGTSSKTFSEGQTLFKKLAVVKFDRDENIALGLSKRSVRNERWMLPVWRSSPHELKAGKKQPPHNNTDFRAWIMRPRRSSRFLRKCTDSGNSQDSLYTLCDKRIPVWNEQLQQLIAEAHNYFLTEGFMCRSIVTTPPNNLAIRSTSIYGGSEDKAATKAELLTQ